MADRRPVLGIVGVAHIIVIAAWLQETGVPDLARYIRREFLTGTAITILVALLILLVPAGTARPAPATRCDVCGHAGAAGRYCTACGSRR